MNDKPNFSGEELDFLNLVLMVGHTASVELGLKPAAEGAPLKENLPRARTFINMLVILEKKCQGRLTPQEGEVLKKLVQDLQEKYVKASGLGEGGVSPIGQIAAQAYARTRKPQP